jgi:hypothetical protein
LRIHGTLKHNYSTENISVAALRPLPCDKLSTAEKAALTSVKS